MFVINAATRTFHHLDLASSSLHAICAKPSQLSVLIFEFLVQCCQLVLDGLHLSGSACSWGQQCGYILTPAWLLHLL